MRKFAATALAVMASIGLGACGSAVKPHHVTPRPHQAQALKCSPNDYVMQCAYRAPGQTKSVGVFAQQFGLDFAWGGPPAYFAKAHGAHFGASYLSGTSKDWRYSLLHDYVNHGLGAVLVWETSAARSLSGCWAGAADARAAAREASALGFSRAPVFFASDFDTSGFGYHGSVGAYYACTHSVIGNRAGAYGGLNTMLIARANGLTRLWQTLAWSYGRRAPGVCLYQSSINHSWYGYSADYDVALCADYGQVNFKPSPPPPPRLICFGRHANVRNVTCQRVRTQVARWNRAAASSLRAFEKRGCLELAVREHWFARQIRLHPRSPRTAYRHRALAATRRVYARQSCVVFKNRVSYFDQKSLRTRRQYS